MDRTIDGVGASGKDSADAGRVEALARAVLRSGALLGTRIFGDLDLHPSDRTALRILDELSTTATPVTNALLARRLGRSPSATVALVDRLAQAGLVRRDRDAGDRRRVHIALTDRARSAGATHLRPYAERIATAVAGLRPDELPVVADFLTAILDPADSAHP